MARVPSKKHRVFQLPGGAKNPYPASAPPPAAKAQQPKVPAQRALTFEVSDAEASYAVRAMLDARTKAQAQQANAEAAGDMQQSLVFGQKARILGELAGRVARAFTPSSR